jgi:hypothetical protein
MRVAALWRGVLPGFLEHLDEASLEVPYLLDVPFDVLRNPL